ncbi:phosphoglycolate phosphatase [Halopseudomonas salegens]|uniref:Phosphoglycolate phosphatase n=1 Tax=Halopseudomonas salegens TaxID=1434072 RepID=A0A1H2DYJ5_9GAMM|nr:phosphoglycolate phosphatase [Halopseudomonas salegens]
MTRLQKFFPDKSPQLVMFDLDGTLIDSVPDLAAAVDRMLQQRGRARAGVDKVRLWVGNGARVLVRRALAGSIEHAMVDEVEADAALADFLQAYAADHSRSQLYPGVREYLDYLQQQGTPLALITNKPSSFLPDLLAAHGLQQHFTWVLGGDSLPVQKPDPAALHQVLAEAQVSARQALFVGDSRSDILAARAAGVPVAAVTYGYNHGRPISEENPDLLVDSLAALI